jgi:hypothetical protein
MISYCLRLIIYQISKLKIRIKNFYSLFLFISNIFFRFVPNKTQQFMTVIKSISGIVIYESNQDTIKKAIEDAVFKKVNLTGADLTDANLTGADLTDANLTRAYLRSADLTRAYLRSADLKGAYLTGAYLTGADLTGADLKGAYLTDANLTRAYLRSADLTGANLTRAYLRSADLTDANLTRAYLRSADLTGADLTDANLTRAYLTGAYLTGANLTGADLTGATLTGAIKLPIYCKWSHGITDRLIHIGCEKRSIEDWDIFFNSNQVIQTPRNTEEFKKIQAVYLAYRAYLTHLQS